MRALALDEAAAIRLAGSAVRGRRGQDAWAGLRGSFLESCRSPAGDAAGLMGFPGRSRADSAAIAGEFAAGALEHDRTIPRRQRVTITLHDEPDAEGVVAAVRPWLDVHRLVGTGGVRRANATVDGRGVVVETVVATSSDQDQEDADDILTRCLRGDDAAEAWTHSPRRLSEAAVVALWDLEVPDRDTGCPLPSKASAISVAAQPLGVPQHEPVSPAGCIAAAPPGERQVAVGVTLGGQRDPGATAARMREAQDDIRSEGRPAEMPTYPYAHVDDGQRISITYRVRTDGEMSIASDLLSALVAALLNVSRACELMGTVVAPQVSAIAQPFR